MKKEYDLHLPWDNTKTAKIFSVLHVELFLRLNPHWIIDSFSSSSESYSAQITDHATEQSFVLGGSFDRDQAGYVKITANSGDWHTITFLERKGVLHAKVAYTDVPSEEVEKLLVFWLRSIKEYLRLYTTTTLNTLVFRFLMNRIILKMTPSQRKISLMLIRITVLELLVILLILVGWFFFG